MRTRARNAWSLACASRSSSRSVSLADDRPDRPTDRVVGMIDGRLREREQDPALAAHVLQIGQ